MSGVAFIVGAGSGLSGSLGRLLEREGFDVALAARNPDKLQTKGLALRCDATDRAQVEAAFEAVERKWGVPDLVVYNASYRTRETARRARSSGKSRSLSISAFAGFPGRPVGGEAHAAARLGAIFFTGASASVKGYANSAPFAMGKFALRGLAQSMARELSPKGPPYRALRDRWRHRQGCEEMPSSIPTKSRRRT